MRVFGVVNQNGGQSSVPGRLNLAKKKSSATCATLAKGAHGRKSLVRGMDDVKGEPDAPAVRRDALAFDDYDAIY